MIVRQLPTEQIRYPTLGFLTTATSMAATATTD